MTLFGVSGCWDIWLMQIFRSFSFGACESSFLIELTRKRQVIALMYAWGVKFANEHFKDFEIAWSLDSTKRKYGYFHENNLSGET